MAEDDVNAAAALHQRVPDGEFLGAVILTALVPSPRAAFLVSLRQRTRQSSL
jgi:hypothetical protein